VQIGPIHGFSTRDMSDITDINITM